MNHFQQTGLAFDIASKLDDTKSLGLHEHFVSKCPAQFLLEQLNFVLSLPDEKITTTRARYYTHLVKTRGSAYLYDSRY